MVLTYAKVMGIIFLAIGIMGFFPALAPDGMLLGIFMVDTAHNIIHLLSGAVFLAVGFSNNFELARKVTLAFAAVYGLVTVLGFVSADNDVMGISMNMADNVLHLAITASALLFGLPQRYAMPR